jgi:alpha-L-rhamnosidase
MYRIVGGIEIGAPGYKKVVIQPQPHDSLDYARASFESPYGLIESSWERKGKQMTVKVRIPPNTTASVSLPYTDLETTFTNNTSKKDQPVLKNMKQYGNHISFELGSGEYDFQYQMK